MSAWMIGAYLATGAPIAWVAAGNAFWYDAAGRKRKEDDYWQSAGAFVMTLVFWPLVSLGWIWWKQAQRLLHKPKVARLADDKRRLAEVMETNRRNERQLGVGDENWKEPW